MLELGGNGFLCIGWDGDSLSWMVTDCCAGWHFLNHVPMVILAVQLAGMFGGCMLHQKVLYGDLTIMLNIKKSTIVVATNTSNIMSMVLNN